MDHHSGKFILDDLVSEAKEKFPVGTRWRFEVDDDTILILDHYVAKGTKEVIVRARYGCGCCSDAFNYTWLASQKLHAL